MITKNITRYVVTAADYGFGTDGKARVLGHFRTYDEAVGYVKADMLAHKNYHKDENFDYDMTRFDAWDEDDPSYGCGWNIEECKIEVDLSLAE